MKILLVMLVLTFVSGCSTGSLIKDLVKPTEGITAQAQIGAENHQEKSSQLVKANVQSVSESADTLSTGALTASPVVGTKSTKSSNTSIGTVQASTVQFVHTELPKWWEYLALISFCMNGVLGVLWLRSLNKAKQ
ncbi:hypothetical protein PM16_42 [Proteus phage PM16]|uniref:Uncharacterized protein n=1 Tax=Proteus phage PM16 TaxID=1357704 RepID=A0A0A6ZKE0_9CAUD|nr:Rz-like spanin [Proteus phage PM16]AGZ17286.1 hypothetical protein PM16_42 [Proteus phage PM16]